MTILTREEIKDRLVEYPSQTLRRVVDSNRRKADINRRLAEEEEAVVEAAEEIIKERSAA